MSDIQSPDEGGAAGTTVRIFRLRPLKVSSRYWQSSAWVEDATFMQSAVYCYTGAREVPRYEDVLDPVCHPKGLVIRVDTVSIGGGLLWWGPLAGSR